MRLLLIAYEFPPSPSPQALRWTYLARELVALGHDVHVLAPDLGGTTPGLPALPAGVTVHRTFAGPFRGLMALRRKQRARQAMRAADDTDSEPQAMPDAPAALRPPRNWKQRVSETVQSALEFVLFPDLRGEWKPWAMRTLGPLLDTLRPDVVISSHEPATTLELGLLAAKRGIPWVADLGDPVLAGYTPRRWHTRALRVERDTCHYADLITLTSAAAATLLQERHGTLPNVALLLQGFDAAQAQANHAHALPRDPARLELFYSGSLYKFRRIDALIDALNAVPCARLSIAAITVPEHILALADALPDQVRLLGFLPHLDVLRMQRQTDVLVNIANADARQIPGKFYEYLGAQRPILHLGDADDPMGALVHGLRRGWVCAGQAPALSALLADMAHAHATGALDAQLDLTLPPVASYSWQATAARLDALLRQLPAQRAGRLTAAAPAPGVR